MYPAFSLAEWFSSPSLRAEVRICIHNVIWQLRGRLIIIIKIKKNPSSVRLPSPWKFQQIFWLFKSSSLFVRWKWGHLILRNLLTQSHRRWIENKSRAYSANKNIKLKWNYIYILTDQALPSGQPNQISAQTIKTIIIRNSLF